MLQTVHVPRCRASAHSRFRSWKMADPHPEPDSASVAPHTAPAHSAFGPAPPDCHARHTPLREAPESPPSACSRMQTAPVTPLSEQGNSAATGATQRRVAMAAAVIALGNILSRGLGLLRDVVIASTFGATGGTDAFVFARTI